MRLEGKSAVITGGGTGIGRATAELFAAEGARVMIIGRREEPLSDTVAEIRASGGSADYRRADISQTEDVKRAVGAATEAFGRIDILYNNAAVFVGIGKTIADLPEEEWDHLMSINLRGVFLFSKYVVQHMIAEGGGVIVNCSSISGHIAQAKQGAYNVAKGGIGMLTKCMALDFAPHNIRVNCVCPAYVQIERNRDDHKDRRADKDRRAEIDRLHPIGRMGQPEDIAPAILYLASDESSWVTGTSLFVDGGYLMV